MSNKKNKMNDLCQPAENLLLVFVVGVAIFCVGALVGRLATLYSSKAQKEQKDKKEAYKSHMRQQFPQKFAHFELKKFFKYGTVPEDFCPEFELIDQEEK